jgi:hypothetical protein
MDMQNPAEVRAFSEQTRSYRRLFPVPFEPHSIRLQALAFTAVKREAEEEWGKGRRK